MIETSRRERQYGMEEMRARMQANPNVHIFTIKWIQHSRKQNDKIV